MTMNFLRLVAATAVSILPFLDQGSAAASDYVILKSARYEIHFPKTGWQQLEPAAHEPNTLIRVGAPGSSGIAMRWCTVARTPFPGGTGAPFRDEVANPAVVPAFKARFEAAMTQAGGENLATKIELIEQAGYPLFRGTAKGTFPFGAGGERLETELRGISAVATDGVYALRCAFHPKLIERPAEEVLAQIDFILSSFALTEEFRLPLSPVGRVIGNTN
ncbi:hypothetical protein [Roseibium sp.]|uniref:hypothetical protein n=2 Tax=Roseibium sp. TaxID=1936156 RepID=UPI003D0C3A2B